MPSPFPEHFRASFSIPVLPCVKPSLPVLPKNLLANRPESNTRIGVIGGKMLESRFRKEAKPASDGSWIKRSGYCVANLNVDDCLKGLIS